MMEFLTDVNDELAPAAVDIFQYYMTDSKKGQVDAANGAHLGVPHRSLLLLVREIIFDRALSLSTQRFFDII